MIEPSQLELIRKAALAELERRRGDTPKRDNKYLAFARKYYSDPAGFIKDCIEFNKGDHPAGYQIEIAKALVDRKRVCVRSPHGVGKTALSSWLILWFALTRDPLIDWKCPTTASAWRQLTEFLWPEVRKWAARLRWDVIGRQPFSQDELLSYSLRLSNGMAFAMATYDASLIEGAHASELLYIFDEAKSIPVDIWDAAEGAFSTGNCMWFAASTPQDAGGRFYEIQRHMRGFDDWYTVHITKDEAIAAGRFSGEWAEQRKRQWGENSPVYLNRVEGEFASYGSAIPLAAIEECEELWKQRKEKNALGKVISIGVDVGEELDKSVIALASSDAIVSIEEYSVNTMELAGIVLNLLRRYQDAIAVIDVVGIGKGLTERLMEFPDVGDRISVFNGKERSPIEADESLGGEFANKRAAAWWILRRKILNKDIALPPHPELRTDLLAVDWKPNSDGRIQAKSKEEIRKQIGRSTDYGDACAMALWTGKDHVVVEISIPGFSFADYRG